MELQLVSQVSGYLMFMVYGVIFVVINSLIAAVISLIFNRKDFLALCRRALTLLRVIKK